MTRGTILFILIGGGFVGGGLFGGPGWASSLAEEHYNAFLDRFDAEPGMEIRERSYDRGLWRSTGRYEIVLSGEGFEALRERAPGEAGSEAETVLVVEDTIKHGPGVIAGGSGSGMARIDSVVRPGEALIDALPVLQDAERLLTAMTRVDWEGGITTDYRTPDAAWEANGVALEFDALSGLLRIAPEMDRFSLDGHLPAMTLREDDGATLTLDTLRFDVEQESITEHLWVGDGVVTLEGLQIDAAGEAMALADLAMESATDVDGERYNTRLQMSAASLRGAEGGMSDGRMALAIEAVDRDALDALAGLSAEAELGTISDEELGRRTLELIPELLAHGPSVTLDPIEATLDDGPVSGRVRVGWAGGTPDNLNPIAMLNALEVDIALTAPWVVIERSLAAREDEGGSAEATLAELQATGLLLRDGDTGHTEVSLRNGSVTANGEQLGPIWQFLGTF